MVTFAGTLGWLSRTGKQFITYFKKMMYSNVLGILKPLTLLFFVGDEIHTNLITV